MIIYDIFTDVKAALEEITDLKSVRLFNSQIDNEAREKQIKFPAAFVEFSNIIWAPLNQSAYNSNLTQQQSGEAIITIHIAFVHYNTETQSFALMAPILEKVFRKLNGLDGDNYTPLMRVAERQDVNHDNVIVWEMDFSTSMYECSEDGTKVEAEDVDLTIDADLKITNHIIQTGKL